VAKYHRSNGLAEIINHIKESEAVPLTAGFGLYCHGARVSLHLPPASPLAQQRGKKKKSRAAASTNVVVCENRFQGNLSGAAYRPERDQDFLSKKNFNHARSRRKYPLMASPLAWARVDGGHAVIVL